MVEYLLGHMDAPPDCVEGRAMKRIMPTCCGLFLGLVAEVILWNGPHWYTHQEDKVPTTLTQVAGVALVVQGAIVALVAALCIARALVPLTLSPAIPGSDPVAIGGGPVLPLCGLLFLLAGLGPLEQSRRSAKDYEFAQSKPGQFQAWAVELDRRLVPVGRAFAVLWFGIGGVLLATPLFLRPQAWQLRRRLNRVGRRYAIGGLFFSVVGIVTWLISELGNAIGGIGGGGHASHELSVVDYLGIIAGAVIAVAGSIGSAAGKSEAGEVTA
jgi:hypothetical protein